MDPWVAKAEAALRTGQPKLAELYMRRGLSESPGGRLWLAGHDVVEAMRGLIRALGITPDPWQWVILERWARTGDVTPPPGFALARPAKGAWW